jgi:hypothetical protein
MLKKGEEGEGKMESWKIGLTERQRKSLQND